MKKALAFLACLTIFCGAFFAEPLDNNDFMAMKEYEETKLQVLRIDPENQHCESDKFAKVWIEYRPFYKTAHIYYETLWSTYDKGEAMNTIIAIREDFMKEKNFKVWKYSKENPEPIEKMKKGNMGKVMQYIVKVEFDY